MSKYLTRYMRLNNAENFKYNFDSNSDDNLFIFVGKTYGWDNGTAPALMDTDKDAIHDIWKDIVHLRRIVNNDIHHVIDRYDWMSGAMYNHFVHDDETLYANTTSFYVKASDNVYKCIANNGASTIQPTGTLSDSFSTADGYIWKFMYNIDSNLQTKFMTNNYLPVQIETNPMLPQYDIQQNAIFGDIQKIQIVEQGTGYVTDAGNISVVSADGYYITLDGSASNISSTYNDYSIFISSGVGAGQIKKITQYNGNTKTIKLESPFSVTPTATSMYIVSPSVVIKGNGINALARTVVDTNGTNIDTIIMVSAGTNYTIATATVIGSTGSGAILNPIISPPNGHGYNAIHELNGINIMIDKNIEFGGKAVDNDFRFYGIVKNPILTSNNSLAIDDLAEGDIYSQTEKLTVVNVDGEFTKDEQIYFINSSDITANVVQFANTNGANTAGVVSITNANNGAFVIGANIKGSSSGTTGVITNIEKGELKISKGTVLFIENFDTEVTRDPSQRENFKITLKF
jgi:hypothetical protein